MSFVSLRSAINSKLSGITQLQVVYQIHTSDLSGFPAATFEPAGNDSDFYTNTDNLRGYAFDIIVHQEVENAGRGNAVSILAAAVDAIISAFDADYNLGGTCDYSLALPSSFGEYTGAQGAVKYAKLTIKCFKEVQVTP